MFRKTFVSAPGGCGLGNKDSVRRVSFIDSDKENYDEAAI
jgi:hypothetical protein